MSHQDCQRDSGHKTHPEGIPKGIALLGTAQFSSRKPLPKQSVLHAPLYGAEAVVLLVQETPLVHSVSVGTTQSVQFAIHHQAHFRSNEAFDEVDYYHEREISYLIDRMRMTLQSIRWSSPVSDGW